jgi:hypothetical protein
MGGRVVSVAGLVIVAAVVAWAGAATPAAARSVGVRRAVVGRPER